MMNKRIRELYNQSLVIRNDDAQWIEGELDSEKFAELIVRECAKFLEENSGYDDSNNAWHPEAEDLLKHFGVE